MTRDPGQSSSISSFREDRECNKLRMFQVYHKKLIFGNGYQHPSCGVNQQTLAGDYILQPPLFGNLARPKQYEPIKRKMMGRREVVEGILLSAWKST